MFHGCKVQYWRRHQPSASHHLRKTFLIYVVFSGVSCYCYSWSSCIGSPWLWVKQMTLAGFVQYFCCTIALLSRLKDHIHARQTPGRVISVNHWSLSRYVHKLCEFLLCVPLLSWFREMICPIKPLACKKLIKPKCSPLKNNWGEAWVNLLPCEGPPCLATGMRCTSRYRCVELRRPKTWFRSPIFGKATGSSVHSS